MGLREELLAKAGGRPLSAAVMLAEGLTQGEPEDFKAGYTRVNAVLAAAEIFNLTPRMIAHGCGWINEYDAWFESLGRPRKVVVIASVPVYVYVDLREGTVERVVVNDEAIDLIDKAINEADGGGVAKRPITDPAIREAVELVTDDAEWPAWEFGW